ncbi:molybdopterin converting factor, small subunit [Desulfocapsa sulfexigens DSM 10523]|uniref:Molybdopterin converting factor, small subunit n=1 Tax=Desulfocapsa sulfexigens (strain DSM 10523 / SB164P1) TaxID=1167006 RepID=M1NDZ7_DESSD|nr:MoaD/ThiS family protein [Desulfocapsa sulfexigens]AGF77929.1 molybdopterin converting factor, small subunit [Desulfocapsa sulfexigens DSM 10523]
MRVQVKLFAFFREGRFIKEDKELPEGTTAGKIVDDLSIDREEVGVLMVNSRHCTFETVLHEGDIYAIFPVIGGG